MALPPLGAIMDTNESTFIIIGILTVALFALYSRFSSKLQVPGPGLRQYLPGGLVYPIYKDPATSLTTVHALSREYGDVFQMRLGPSVALVTCVPEDIVHIYSNIDLFPRAPAIQAAFEASMPGGLFTMEGELHKETKKTLRERFNYSMLEGFHPSMTIAINELCNNLTNYVGEQSNTNTPKVIDISEEIAMTTFQVIMNVGYGMRMSKPERLQMAELTETLVQEMMKESMEYPVRQALTPFGVRKRFMEVRNKILNLCQDMVKTRLQETKSEKDGRHADVMDTILAVKHLEGRDAASMAMEFVVAGFHTTSQILVWCLYEICRNRHIVERIDEELSSHLVDRSLSEPVTAEDLEKLGYFNLLWKETLRLHSIGVGVLRIAMADVTLRGSGTIVPKGTLVMANTSRVQIHENIWEDPRSFKPERWESDNGPSEGERVPRGCYVPFGVGTKACVGRFLADYEGPLILMELYRRFRFQLACEPHEVVCCTHFVNTLRTSSKVGGPLDRGLPVVVTLK